MKQILQNLKTGRVKVMSAITFLIIMALAGCFSRQETALSEQYEYDKEGQLICRTTPDGSKIKYKYNDQGLPVEINYPDNPVRYDYDANGNRIWMQNKNGKTEYKYDAFDRLVEVIFKYSPEKRINYEYDPWNRISAIKIWDAQNNSYQVKYEYNILGNLTSIDDGNGKIEYSYFPGKGEIVRHLPNGIRTVFSYLPVGELISLKHFDAQNGLLASYRYEYSPQGKISRVFEDTSEGAKITRFEWDNRGYLKALQMPDGNNIRYEYDVMGNRISMKDLKGTITYSYDKFGRLTKAGEIKYEWDDNGNLAMEIERSSKTRFRYDTRNLPLLVKTPNETIHYKWDGDGNLISRGAGKDINYYLPNPLAPLGFTLAEFDSSGRLKSSFLYGDSLLGQRDSNGKMEYFLEDGSNSIRQIADVNGKIIKHQDFTPFAEPILVKGNAIPDFRMAGERFLPEIKESLIGNRLYDPSNGQYLSPDPASVYLERFDSFNRYTHGSPDPSSFMEPKCNQTRKNYRVTSPEAQIGLNLFRAYRDTFIVWGIGQGYEWVAKQALGELWGGVLGKTMKGAVLRPFSFWTSLERKELERARKGQAFGSPEFWKDWGKSGMGMLGGAIGATINPYVSLGTAFLFRTAAEGWDIFTYHSGIIGWKAWYQLVKHVGGLGQFYGTRMDRPYWWWSPMKWIPQEQYLKRLEEQGRRQATVAAEADRKKYKDDQRKPLLEEGQKKALDIRTKKKRDESPPPPPGCPPFCCPPICDDGGGPGGPGGGGPGGPGGPFDGRFDGPFKSIEAKLGGIKLDASAQFTGSLGNIAGAVYDPEKQVLVLVGDENISLPSMKPEDLAVALISVFGSDHVPPQDPQFSLDPADPNNPRGKWLRAVYMPEQIIGGTEFGKALFEADWLLKQYSFGVFLDAEGKMHERKSSVAGFKSTAVLSYDEKDRGPQKEKWNRFWIVSEEMKLRQSGKCIYFDSARMRVKSKKQVPDQNSRTGLSDVDSEDDLVAKKFAKEFTDLYDEIAKESPEFERVRQLAKAVAIAKWMKQEGIPFDTRWVNEYANKRVDTVGRVTALSTQWEKSNQTPFQSGNQSGILTQIRKIHLFGGVDLTVKPKYVSDNGTAQGLQKAITANLRGKVIEPTFDVNYNGKSYHAVVLPVTHKGQEIWKNSPITTVNGTKYQFNSRGDVAKSIDSYGNISEYVWDANHKLNEFKITTNNGWTVLGSRKNGYSEITITNPRQNKFLYRYTPSGYLNEVFVNGQRYASINYGTGDTTINYGNYMERIRYDKAGHIKRYEVYPYRDGAPSGKPQAVDMNYDKDGNVTEIYIPDAEHMKLVYSNGNITTVSTSRGKVNYLYEAQAGRIAQINTTWGESTRYDYEGNNLTQIAYKNGDYHKDVIFKDNLLVEVKGDYGEITKYKYNANGFLEQVIDPRGAYGSYSYDNQNRLKTVGLPDGSSINFQYEWYRSKDSKGPVLKRVKVAQIASKKSSSPITESKTAKPDEAKEISRALTNRLEDIKEAGRNLRNGLIIDLFVGEKDTVHVNFVDAGGNVQRVNPEVSKELGKLLNITATTHGKLGNSLIARWQRFYNTNLSHLSKPTSWICPDGRPVKIKPILIIKSNEVNYKYANLEKVPVLADNFIIFIANKAKETDTSETSAKDLVTKINNIPKPTKRNLAFIIRLPDMSKSEREKWHKEIHNLQKLIGKNNVLVDPSKEEFEGMLQNKGKDIIAIELTHTDRGILLKNGERYTSKDIKQSGDLSHIKYLISGIGTCNLPRLEDGRFAASLRGKGVGIINASYREVSSDVALEKLRELINILRNIEKYDLYPYHLIDIIDQRLGISGEGTTNLGKREEGRDYFLG